MSWRRDDDSGDGHTGSGYDRTGGPGILLMISETRVTPSLRDEPT